MSARQQVRLLPGGRLHLQDGPIDLVIAADGTPEAVRAAFAAAIGRFATVLDELCTELPGLRRPAQPEAPPFAGRIARRMAAAVAPFAATFITPMAAVAGAVAEEIRDAMAGAAPLDRAFVNNGGDIALHLAAGQRYAVGLVDRPDRPSLFGRATLEEADPVRGLATSGWRGRSFSRGIADAVTVLAATAAMADAAATVIANAVDLPGDRRIARVPASSLQADSDLGDRLVTRAVPTLPPEAIDHALGAGLACAESLVVRGLIAGAALHLQGETRTVGPCPVVRDARLLLVGKTDAETKEGRAPATLPSSGLRPPSPRRGEGAQSGHKAQPDPSNLHARAVHA